MSMYTKKQQMIFLDAMRNYLQGRKVLDTAYGPYTVTGVSASALSLNCMGRFEDVERLQGLPVISPNVRLLSHYGHRWIGDTQVNQYSGKWNFHFVNAESHNGDQAAGYVIRCLEMVKSVEAVAEARAFEEEGT